MTGMSMSAVRDLGCGRGSTRADLGPSPRRAMNAPAQLGVRDRWLVCRLRTAYWVQGHVLHDALEREIREDEVMQLGIEPI